MFNDRKRVEIVEQQGIVERFYYLRRVANGVISLSFLTAWFLLINERWDASLILLQSLHVVESIFVVTVNGVYYAAVLFLFLLLFPVAQNTSTARRLGVLFVFIIWLIIEALGASFARAIGDGASLFTLYYLLTQFHLLSGSYSAFLLIFAFVCLLLSGLIAWLIWGLNKQKKHIKLKLAGVCVVLMSLNLALWLTP